MKFRPVLGLFFLSALLVGCKKDPLRLVCNPVQLYGDKVALEIDEEGSTAKLLDPYSLLPADENPIVAAHVLPTTIHLTESDQSKFWILDRTTGKLSRNKPDGEWYCSTGRRF